MFLPGQLSTLQPTGSLPEVAISAPIEPFAVRVPPSKCDHMPKPGVVAFRAFVLEHLGGGDSGICRSCAGKAPTGEHNEGRAWDWRVLATNPADVARVEKLFAWLFKPDLDGNPEANFRRAGLRYMIWDRKIWSSGRREWVPYSGSPHRDHVHITFSWPGALGETSFYHWLKGTAPPGPVPPGPGPTPEPFDWKPLAALCAGTGLGYWASGLWRGGRR
jgi:hypothetical protein